MGRGLGPVSAGTRIATLSYPALGGLVAACALLSLLLVAPVAIAMRCAVP